MNATNCTIIYLKNTCLSEILSRNVFISYKVIIPKTSLIFEQTNRLFDYVDILLLLLFEFELLLPIQCFFGIEKEVGERGEQNALLVVARQHFVSNDNDFFECVVYSEKGR